MGLGFAMLRNELSTLLYLILVSKLYKLPRPSSRLEICKMQHEETRISTEISGDFQSVVGHSLCAVVQELSNSIAMRSSRGCCFALLARDPSVIHDVAYK